MHLEQRVAKTLADTELSDRRGHRITLPNLRRLFGRSWSGQDRDSSARVSDAVSNADHRLDVAPAFRAVRRTIRGSTIADWAPRKQSMALHTGAHKQDRQGQDDRDRSARQELLPDVPGCLDHADSVKPVRYHEQIGQ